MPRSLATLLCLATLSAAPAALFSQSTTEPAGPASNNPTQTQPAPIERSAPQALHYGSDVHGSMIAPEDAQMAAQAGNQGAPAQRPSIKTMQPAQGIWVRSAQNASVQTVSASGNRTELRVDHGLANVDIHHPANKGEILVDMPGGQVALLKDGVYTFNADTDTASVFKGEAQAFAGDGNKPVKIKEDHQVNFALASSGAPRATELDPNNSGADLLPTSYAPSYGDGYYGVPAAYYGGYYGYGPYWGWGYPYGYPYWGYPYGIGIGFYGGYYGRGYGFYRGGYGYRGGIGYRGGYGGFRGGYAGGVRGGAVGGGFHGGGGGGFHGGGGGRR